MEELCLIDFGKKDARVEKVVKKAGRESDLIHDRTIIKKIRIRETKNRP